MPGKRPAVPVKPQRLSSSSGDQNLPVRSQAKSTKPHSNKTVVNRAKHSMKDNAGQATGFANESEEAEAEAEAEKESDEDEGSDKDDAENEDAGSSDAGTAPESNDGGQDEGNAAKKKKKPVHPQESIKKFWKNYEPEYEGKVVQLLPDPIPLAASSKVRLQTSQNSRQSYEEARAACIQDVERIVQECLMVNQKYTDPHFDIERDLKITMQRNCFTSLTRDDDNDDVTLPADVKRVTVSADTLIRLI